MRHQSFLRQRYQAILGYTGLTCAIAGLCILAPLLALFAYPEEANLAWGFLLPGLGLSGLGVILWRSLAPKSGATLTLQEGSVIVVLSWFLAVLFGTVPFLTVGGLNFTQAAFESTSGWTTTGLSVVDVTATSNLILLYRSIMELFGGAGLAIITLSAIAGPVGASLSSAEGRAEQLAPNVRRSSKLVVIIYSSLCAIGIVALRISGVGWFDAVNHSFAALSTGGFSTRPDSIGYWDSPFVEAVTIVLMLFGGLNFVTIYLLLTGSIKSVVRNGQVRLQAFMIPLVAVIIFFGSAIGLYPTLGKAVRVSIFEAVTALTTTGFSTVGYGDWNSLPWIGMIVLMLIGGGAGSTAGGIKQLRIYILYRALISESKQMLLPKGAINETQIWQGEQRRFLQAKQIRQVSLFVFLYMAIFFIGSAIMMGYGYSLQDSLFEYASAMGTVGLSVGVTAADAPVGMLWAETVGMFLGRLEFFTVFVGVACMIRDFGPMVSRQTKPSS
ncbi:TrkH family potassium uptake protein [cf. Phormidesmis sp. LEGE 11477]|uniref:TrkH family potassium uptake protein n=1 Tax=cf. Phormidesmis sp. LEGE 11477 TaxID=1828680 RepID=UPI0018802AF6|nr:TrkH family potassium uptake protein [cf. Phormidesmis sp. LEGE 11477]MBE9059707.1 TrkH family potassium uptake protein [cf. Phormidesmis sp. LEGE 11477]